MLTVAEPTPSRRFRVLDGAFMEQSGGKRGRSGANQSGAKSAQTSRKRCPLPPIVARTRKCGGVDGSSPSEGFAKFLLISSFRLSVAARVTRRGVHHASRIRPDVGARLVRLYARARNPRT